MVEDEKKCEFKDSMSKSLRIELLRDLPTPSDLRNFQTIKWNQDSDLVSSTDVKDKLESIFLKGDFFKVTTDALQMVCGHRADIVQQRRDAILKHVKDPLLRKQAQVAIIGAPRRGLLIHMRCLRKAITQKIVCLRKEIHTTHLRKVYNVTVLRKDQTAVVIKGAQTMATCPFGEEVVTKTEERIPEQQPSGRRPPPIERELKMIRGEDSDWTEFRAGQLENFIHQWKSLNAPNYILKMIQGYQIPFVWKPPLLMPNLALQEPSKYYIPQSPEMNKQGRETDCLPGRLLSGTPKQANPSKSREHSVTVARKTRLADQLPEVNYNATETPRVSRDFMGRLAKRKVPTHKEGYKNCGDGQHNVAPRSIKPKEPRSVGRHAKFRQLRDPKRPSKLSFTPKDAELGTSKESDFPFLPSKRGHSGATIVVEQCPSIFINTNANTDSLPYDRCFGCSVGRETEQHQPVGSVGKIRKFTTRKSERAPDSSESIGTESSARASTFVVAVAKRQLDRCSLLEKRRRYSLSDSYGLNIPNLSITRPISDPSQDLLPARNIQLRSGSLIKIKRDASVASSTAGNRGNILQMGETSDRPICISRSPCSSHLCIAGSDGQRSAISRCSQPSLELSTRLGVSSSMSGSEGISTHEYGERNLSSRCASLGARILASRSEEESSVTSPHDLEPSRSPQRHSNFAAASERTRYDSRGMEMWGWSRNLTEWSDEQKNLLKSGWRDSTLKTYKSAWGRWCNWIKDNGADMNCPTGSDLARYLSDLYQKEELAYKTILLHKSVVSTMCNTESSGSLSNHSLVKQVLKAISLKKPKLTKPPIWDLKQLTTYLSTVQVNKDSLYEVSRHTAALLLLCS
ncbi:unnamed protein product [Plutella xylostella]|uniref:(diamondback moth) hypothetical protein n=1 Tax=Plutella xylostella TaxID=51655 RepID=A0A8S4GGF6_PLUXY|nr:unnamed protein product [Plutella xylostella]